MDLDFIDAEARARYTDRRRRDFSQCFHGLLAKDFSILETIGHNLKGNGVSFGYPELSQLGEKMEIAAKSSDLSQCRMYVDQLKDWIDRRG